MIRLAAFDLDGTIVRDRTCVQAIAATLGREEECAAFERLDMRDVAAVTAARQAMAEWYRPHTPNELTAGLSDLALAPGSKEAFALLRRHGVITAVVSITWSFAVEWFALRLGADHTLGTQLSSSGIEHVWPEDKGAWLAALALRLGLVPDQVAAVGDSDGDRELLEAAALRFFVGSKPPVVAGVVHLPGASLLEVAEQILARD